MTATAIVILAIVAIAFLPALLVIGACANAGYQSRLDEAKGITVEQPINTAEKCK